MAMVVLSLSMAIISYIQDSHDDGKLIRCRKNDVDVDA